MQNPRRKYVSTHPPPCRIHLLIQRHLPMPMPSCPLLHDWRRRRHGRRCAPPRATTLFSASSAAAAAAAAAEARNAASRCSFRSCSCCWRRCSEKMRWRPAQVPSALSSSNASVCCSLGAAPTAVLAACWRVAASCPRRCSRSAPAPALLSACSWPGLSLRLPADPRLAAGSSCFAAVAAGAGRGVSCTSPAAGRPYLQAARRPSGR